MARKKKPEMRSVRFSVSDKSREKFFTFRKNAKNMYIGMRVTKKMVKDCKEMSEKLMTLLGAYDVAPACDVGKKKKL